MPSPSSYFDRALALAPDWVVPLGAESLASGELAEAISTRRGPSSRPRRPKVGLGNLIGYMNPDAVFLVPEDRATRSAFEQLAVGDFEDDTALYAHHQGRVVSAARRDRQGAALQRLGAAGSRGGAAGGPGAALAPGIPGYAYAGLGRRDDAVREGVAGEAWWRRTR